MKAFTHIVVDGPSVVRWAVTDDKGTVRIEVTSGPHQHLVIEIPDLSRLVLEE